MKTQKANSLSCNISIDEHHEMPNYKSMYQESQIFLLCTVSLMKNEPLPPRSEHVLNPNSAYMYQYFSYIFY